jgi:hypothetical protein
VRLNKRSLAVQSGIGLHKEDCLKEGEGNGVEQGTEKIKGTETVRMMFPILRKKIVYETRDGKKKMV